MPRRCFRTRRFRICESVLAARSHKSVLKCRNSNKLITHSNLSTQCKWRDCRWAERVRARDVKGRGTWKQGPKCGTIARTFFPSLALNKRIVAQFIIRPAFGLTMLLAVFIHWVKSNGKAENNHTKWQIANMVAHLAPTECAAGRLNYYLQMIFSELKGNDNKIKLKHNCTTVGMVRRPPCKLPLLRSTKPMA